MSRATQIASGFFSAAVIAGALVVATMLGSARLEAAEEPEPATFVSLKYEGSCDERNNRLWLSNTHTFKTVATIVRWRAAGGKDLTEEFFASPNSVREIGCAAEAEILRANFAQF